MKIIFKLFILSLLPLGVFSSCDDDHVKPNRTIQDNFKSMFPDAKRVEWEIERSYYVADFHEKGYEKEAWFDSDGTWWLTTTDMERNIPDIIKAAVDKTNYKDWRIEDVKYIEQRDKEAFYIVEVEKGESEIDLYFSENGEFIKEVNENGNHRPTPF